MKYFNKCKTAEELKKEYKEMAKKLHPDNGGNTSEFQEMQADFSSMWEQLKDIHMNASGEAYTKETTETAGEYMDIIEILIHLDGVQTVICGKWIWCSGNTRQHKDTLKRIGFKWARHKEAWYFHSGPYHRRHNREYSLDDIRDMYGSKAFRKKEQEQNIQIAMV